MARESSFWKWLRGKISPLGHFTRIESEISAGVPDVYYALDTIEDLSGWIELKSVAAPKTDKAKPLLRKGLSEEQVEWIDTHWNAGVAVGIMVKMGRTVYCFKGSHARYLNSYTFRELRFLANFQLTGSDRKWIQSKFLDFLRALKTRS